MDMMGHDEQIDLDFDALVRRVARGLPGHAGIEDAVQEALIRAWLELERGHTFRSTEAWVVRAARNVAVDGLRRRDAEVRALRRLGPADAFEADPDAALPQWLEVIPERQRAALVLHYVDGLRVREVAEAMGTTLGTAKSQLHRGRVALARAFASRKEKAMSTGRTGWFMAGESPDDYEATSTRAGSRTAVHVRAIGKPDGFGTLMQSIGAENYRGKRVRLSADVRCDELTGWAGLWMRVDPLGRGNHLAFDNMNDRPIVGSRDWAREAVVLDVSEEAGSLHFGVLIYGAGSLDMADVRLEVVGNDVATTGEKTYPTEPTNLDFSEAI